MDRQRDEDEWAALASAWPRALIESGTAGRITDVWRARARQATEAGQPPWPRFSLDRLLADGLFEVRRARRVVRGLEGAGEALDRERAGLSRSAATRSSGRRISRLLLLGADGAPRFYRQAEKLAERHRDRLEVAVIEADEATLGAALYGGGQRVRAALIDHKDAVMALLERLAEQKPGEGAGNAGSGAGPEVSD